MHVPPPHFRWPVITKAIEAKVVHQLAESVSIYDRSGIFEQFEEGFAAYHGVKHALLFNSGTSALLAMYFAGEFRPGDEVLVPAYGFPATVSPLSILGLKPVFVDVDESGNPQPSELLANVTERTRALVVSHIWGHPAQMHEIVGIASRLNLVLFEDCSHAHGARIGNQLVGTFGDAAVWSLQGQKTISAGEGGVLATDDDEIYARALIFGHYNKRPKQELEPGHPLYPYFETGFGLKLRAHPLGIAIAMDMLAHLDDILAARSQYAAELGQVIGEFPWIGSPPTYEGTDRASWYAFTFRVRDANEREVESLRKALLAEGLLEIDRPKSTGLMAHKELFRKPTVAFQWARESESVNQVFPAASRLVETTLKLPVWSEMGDKHLADQYCEGLHKVLRQYPTLVDSTD